MHANKANIDHQLCHFSVDGYCAETNTVYEFFGFYWHGGACQPFRDNITTNGDTLAARYEETMARFEQITRAGYQVEVQWGCEFDDACIEEPEMPAHTKVFQSQLSTMDAL